MTARRARRMPRLQIESVRHVHIIGICGTAMGTLGAMLVERGYEVSGSDAMAYPPMSDWLAARGMRVLSGYDATHLPEVCDLVVVGNVARRDNPESVAAHERGIPCLSLPEVLRAVFLSGRRALVVTGTHGKTTTTAWTTQLLDAAGRDPSMFVGGVTVNYDSSFRLGTGPEFVVEGDEYDTAWFDKVPKFWHYPAFSATINNIEFDHGDIYADIREIEHVFQQFANSVDPRGTLWINGDDERCIRVSQDCWATVKTFGLGSTNDVRAVVLGTNEAGTRIEVFQNSESLGECQLPTIGAHNVRNFLGAACLATTAGVPLTASMAHAAAFQGVRKRQELVGEADGVLVYDDFAHHPSAVRETLAALRARYPERTIRAVFEAKSNTSRRRIFQQEYVTAFDAADEIVFSQPWKADALDSTELLDLAQLVSDIQARGKKVSLIASVDDIVEHLRRECGRGDVVAGLSGSSFGGLHRRALAALSERG
jgi:UDP-N-acetylmuramate: L-alanyl-gamma-D-glutamyl-meso-diaminopimelate ligase